MPRRVLAAVLLSITALSCTAGVGVVTSSPSPSPTSTVTVTAPPSPSPTPSPTLPPPPPSTQQPTSTAAGQRLLPYYLEIRQLFPTVFPPVAYILPDEAITSDADAAFQGLASDGVPQFSVRVNFAIDKATAAHECGHAYEKLLERLGPPSRDVMALYWSFRGFPGTWQDALKQSQLATTSADRWSLNPYESWAEAFRIGVMLSGTEKTEDYKKPVDATAARQFFISLIPKQ